MDEYRTNRHWKREQDNYLTQIGAMEKIKQDPMASLGYKVRSDPEMLTLNMGANPGDVNYGLYKFFNSPEKLYSRKPRSDGSLDVQVGLSPDRYAKTTVHELGHAGSRNSGTDFDYSARVASGDEELNRRYADYLLWPPGHPGHEDAKAHLINTFKIEDYDEQAKAYGRKVGIISEADRTAESDRTLKSEKADKEPSKKSPKPVPKPARKKKKKTLIDYFRQDTP